MFAGMLHWVPVLVLLGGAEPVAGSLEARLAPLARAHQGKVAIAVKHLESGASFYLNADEPMPTASLIKVAVMIEAYQQASEGRLLLADRVTLRTADKTPGSGILSEHFSEGASFSLRDAVRLMMVYSDNTATNLVLDKVGIAAVNRRMEAWGYPQTRIHAKVFRGGTTSIDPERTRRFGLGSTTAREMASLMEELQVGQRMRPALKQIMLGHMKKNNDADKFPRLLPRGTVIAHKDGAVSDARTDAGILYAPGGPIVVCVLTTGNADRRWVSENAGNLLCARVAREVYDYFANQDNVTIRLK
jgi:beta-lactamase class A